MSICKKCGGAFTEELINTCPVGDLAHVAVGSAAFASAAVTGNANSNWFNLDSATKLLDTGLDIGIDVWQATTKKTGEMAESVSEAVSEKISAAADMLPDTSTVESAAEFVQNLGAGVLDTAGSVGSSVLDGVGAVAEGAGEVVGAVAEAAGDILSGL